MNVTREDTGNLTASLKVQVNKEDYEEKVNKTLRDYQRKTSMPGFRPGKVPFGVVSKMYRKGVLLDEINHLISDNLNQYVQDNQLRLIGSPLPNKEKSASIDLDEQSDFEFTFDIGLAPEFELNLDQIPDIERLKIKASDKMVEEYVLDLRKRHQHKEEPAEASAEPQDTAEELAELNADFFSHIFPGQDISNETDFREKIRESIEQSLVKESDRYFLNNAIEQLVNEVKLELPENFIRRLIEENDQHDHNEEEKAGHFENFTRSLKWQLIESRLIQDHQLMVEEQEMRDVVRGYFTGAAPNAGENPEYAERLNQIVDSVLSNEKEAGRLHDQLFEQKLLTFFKEHIKFKEKDVDYDEFVNLLTQKKA